MFVQQVLHAMDAETLTFGIGKQYVVVPSLRLSHPGFQHGEGRLGNGCTASLASFADHLDVRTRAKDEALSGFLNAVTLGNTRP